MLIKFKIIFAKYCKSMKISLLWYFVKYYVVTFKHSDNLK